MATADAAPAARNLEIELKLRATPQVLERLRRSHLVRERAEARVRTRNLATTYFDTPDLRLSKRGIALRVRKDGRRFEQTVKNGEVGGGVAQRIEWNNAVTANTPDLAAIADPEARAAVGLVLPGELQPVFTSRIRRRSCVVNGTDASGTPCRVELAFDDGLLATETGEAPLAEVELELLDGAPAALYDLALAMCAVAPLQVETRSKAARGFALAADGTPEPYKAAAVALEPAMTVEDALAAIVRACLAQALANQPAAVDGRDPEGVHQLRVGLRRLRSAFTLFKKMIPPAQYGWLRGESRWLAGELGDARDWDVFLTELLAPLEADGASPGLARLRAEAESQRAAGYVQARAALDDVRATSFVLRLGAWLEGRRWREDGDPDRIALRTAPVQVLADALLAKRQRAALKAGRHFAELSAEERHLVRIALKKLRYAVEFFESLYDGDKIKRFRKRLTRLQNDLGALNDLAVARARLTGLAPVRKDPEVALAAGEVLGWHGRAAQQDSEGVLEDWQDFADVKPFWQ